MLSTGMRVAFAHLRQRTPLRVSMTDPWVLVFPEHKVAYIPIPKAANSSVRAALLPLIGEEPSEVKRIQAFQGFQKLRYSRFAEVRQPGWFVFTVVRDPYSRYASGYLNKLVTRKEVLRPLRRMGLKKGDSFARYMMLLKAWPQEALNEHFAPQAIMLGDAINDALSVYKMEELSERWPEIAARIREASGVEVSHVGHRNKGKAGVPWRSIYDDDTKEMAKNLGQHDFAIFGYPS
jgi:hypothetical protein